LADLGLGDRAGSSADRVSLGQSKRVAIARAVQAGVRVLCLDEPLAGLDAEGIEEVMGLLRELVKENEITIIIVEHIFNIPRVLKLATTIWTLEQGELSTESTSNYFQMEQSHTKILSWLEELAETNGKQINIPLNGGATLSLLTPYYREIGESILEVENLVVYINKRLVIGQLEDENSVRGISFTVCHGQLAILEAPNGWGKTTLLNAIAGLVPIAQGKIYINGKQINHLKVWERVKIGLSYLRSSSQVFNSLTVWEMMKISGKDDCTIGLESILNKKVAALSGGERQKVVLASMQNKSNSLCLMDEPFNALDMQNMGTLMNGLKSLNKETASCFIAIPSSL
jgi:ABC-type multidrug transport system ATPase subunit